MAKPLHTPRQKPMIRLMEWRLAGRQRLHPQHLPTIIVSAISELLKQQTEHHGDEKAQISFMGLPLGHILGACALAALFFLASMSRYRSLTDNKFTLNPRIWQK